MSPIPRALPLLLALAAPAFVRAEANPSEFKIFLSEPGVYAVSYESLAAAGLEGQTPSASLGVTNQGEPVPIHVVDGGDGRFGPGDRIELVGDRLPGEASYANEYSNLNVYLLSTDARAPLRMTAPSGGVPAATKPAALTSRQRFERDLLFLRFPTADDRPIELWYWAKLTQIDSPFRQRIDLSDLDVEAPRPLHLAIELRGWSQPLRRAPKMKDHRVEIAIDGRMVGSGEWDNAEGAHAIEIDLPAAALGAGEHELSIKIPSRISPETQDMLIDVAVLNSIAISYPRKADVDREPARLAVEGDGPIVLRVPAGARPTIYGEGGSRVEPNAMQRVSAADGHDRLTFALPHTETGLWVAASERLRPPVAVERDVPSSWAATDRRADYLIIAHPRLLSAIEPLAAFHRSQGLAVEVVNVEDLYDEFNHGILHPRAIKAFLRHARRDWAPPAPRFVLLVGDASWDPKNLRPDDREEYVDAAYNPAHGTEFAKILSTPYSEREALDHRNLVPTWNYGTFDGHAAGDNWFVDVEGDDLKPEMAIGRLPVVEPAEVAAIVDKTIRYASRPEVGPWRRELVWVTNEEPVMQGWSDELALDFAKRGFASRKVYPKPEDTPGESHDQDLLLRTLSQGELLVHFIGHGGRFIWRTGPPDWTKHRDLFNLEDLDRLPESGRLPLVLSMTCYSAPFDHPTADSIGEKFLRLGGKGAIAVIAASWRNAPYKQMSDSLLTELLAPGVPIGEGLMRAKRRSNDVEFNKQYNLLGDPALELARPEPLDVAATAAASGPAVTARLADGRDLPVHAIVDWLDHEGKVVVSDQVATSGPTLEARFGGNESAAAAITSVRVYVWDPTTGRDAAGAVRLPAPAPETVSK